MEIALDPAIPTYAGGLGVLAGDTVKSAADLKVPMVAVTLLHRKGYLSQRFDSSGWQREETCGWDVQQHLEEMPQRITVMIESRLVQVRAWRRLVKGLGADAVPVYFLDTDIPENAPWDRTITDFLYGGDGYYRICQEVVLGIGGVRMLRALGHDKLTRFHMNEGHAGLLVLELLDEAASDAGRSRFTREDVDSVRKQCVFTTHTPVASGHDKFSLDLATAVLGRDEVDAMKDIFCCAGTLNMTFLALNLSHYVNGVAGKHAETARNLFADYKAINIDAITNGVHAATWTSPAFQMLFDARIPGWRGDNFSLRFAHNLPLEEVRNAHQSAKRSLLEEIHRETGVQLDPTAFTLGFARRMTAYKRNDLLFTDAERLKRIAASAGPIQIVCAGKAHPNDSQGKETIQRILRLREQLGDRVCLVYLENYGLELAALLTAGVDVWLNTPLAPYEASGTSGMKAALNGVPSLSILDGWWVEGWIEGETGWAIGGQYGKGDGPDRNTCDADSLYDKLENVVLPLFYRNPNGFGEVMRHAISLNGSFFNTQRMLSQYTVKAYLA
jgi:starch phosphorylase